VRLLVVEDERRLAASLKRGLTRDGFAVDVALDGTDGLWRARECRYDAVVLDIMLPGINGYRLCAMLRAEGNWTPVLMLTAKDGEYDELEGLETGADDYLVKPFSHAILVARLRALLRRGAPQRPVVLSCGDLTLDPGTRTAARAGQSLSLTSREFAVLEYLIRNAGQVLSKRDILAHVWDDDFDGDPNIVEVYVCYLRRKVDLPFGRQDLETVRGFGYRLAVPDGS